VNRQAKTATETYERRNETTSDEADQQSKTKLRAHLENASREISSLLRIQRMRIPAMATVAMVAWLRSHWMYETAGHHLPHAVTAHGTDKSPRLDEYALKERRGHEMTPRRRGKRSQTATPETCIRCCETVE